MKRIIALLLAVLLLAGLLNIGIVAYADELPEGGTGESTGTTDTGTTGTGDTGTGTTDTGTTGTGDTGTGTTDTGTTGTGDTGTGTTDTGTTGTGDTGTGDTGTGDTGTTTDDPDLAAEEAATSKYPEHPGPSGDYDAYEIPQIIELSVDEFPEVSVIEGAAVSFSETRITLLKGTCTDLAMYVTASPSIDDVIWESDDTGVISIDENGLATAETIGSTYVTARVGTVEAQVYMEVVANSMSKETVEFPYKIYVNRSYNCITVYEMDENGEYTIPIRAFRCSTGLKTPINNTQVFNHNAWNGLAGGTVGMWTSWIGGNFLFHSVSFYYSTHNSLKQDWYDLLGTTCSGGCVRLQVINAKWIYDNAPVGTPVFLEYDVDTPGPLGLPEAIDLTGNLGWDPTDPDPDNPWLAGSPVLEGVHDMYVNIGGTVDYFSGVYGTDSIGNDITSRVRVKTTVDTSKDGVYWVEYYLTDSSYQTAHAYCQVTVGNGNTEA